MTGDLTAWWEELKAASLVGTARRQVPGLPALLGASRADARREEELLDGAALGGALRRAGVRTSAPEPVDPAADDLRAPAPSRAVQLLELLLHQSPVGPTLAPELVRAWLDAAAGHDRRSPHHLLPELLDLASRQPRLRDAVLRVGDVRASWLAAANPVWSWGRDTPDSADTATAPPDAGTWARRPTDQRVAEVERLRRSDPAAARDLVESTWTTDPAGDRAALLPALWTGLGADDEPLLERALDDRSSRVRDVAVQLLDALPGSARAARMAERLRPLLHVRGLLPRTLEVDLPLEPDDSGVRDGLDRPRGVGSVRGWWLQRLAAGAPLEVWTEATGTDAAGAWRLLTQQDARVGVVQAVLARRNPAWAAAVAADVWHPGLLPLVPAAQLDAVATSQLARATAPDQVVRVVGAVPPPWGPAFSRAVLQRLMAEKDPTPVLGPLTVPLATGLHPVTRPALERWRDGLEQGPRAAVGRICQYLALVPEIQEAFA